MGIKVKKQYNVILADPPWAYRNFSDKVHGAARSHYRTMAIEDIGRIPVARWAAPGAILLLWGTWPKLPEAMDLLKYWGAEYVTLFPWVKTTPRRESIRTGIGFWAQATSEALIIARFPGKSQKKRKRSPVLGLLVGASQQFYHPIGKHSKKPEGICDWIESLVDGPYLELFATRKRPGWSCWGRVMGYELSAKGVSRCEPEAHLATHIRGKKIKGGFGI